jgi:phosphoglycerate dehydrogenase-like enzyme
MQVIVTATAPGTSRTPREALWPEDQMAGLRAAFPAIQFCDGVTHGALDLIADAEVVFGHLHREEFLAARNLRWVQSHGAGVDWALAIPELVASDVILTSTKGAQAVTIAEHTFGLLIALARQFYTLFEAQQQRCYLRPVEPSPVGL